MSVIESYSSIVTQDCITDYEEYLEEEKIHFYKNFRKKIDYNVTPSDFEQLSLLGVGSFGRVYLTRKKDSENEYYAMKVLIKAFVIKSRQVPNTLGEKQILECIRSPFTVNMAYFCMSNSFLYFILPFVVGGEVFNLLRMVGSFPEKEAKFYVAQVLLGLEYLHYLNLAYRDLKPENLLVDEQGYIKIADFGFCKIVIGRTYTLCGTPDYLAPEVILNKGHSKAVDFWSYGVLVFEMCSGFPPFEAPDMIKLFEKICGGKYRALPTLSREVKDLIKRLLQVDPTKRLGNLVNGHDDIKNHVWFGQINWMAIFNKRIKAPHVPSISGPSDTHNFDPDLDDKILRDAEEEEFKDEFSVF